MGNVPTKKSIKYNSEYLRGLALSYGARMRSMWRASDDAWLVGTDMEGAHLRIFAHLIDDKEFINALITGDKKDGTDAHSLNKRKLGDVCIDRDRAKTFVFSFLNGAGASKVSNIFNCSASLGRKALDDFVQSYPGLVKLKQTIIPAFAAKGYCEGVDGRYIVCNSEHHMIGVLLQSYECVLMKYALSLWKEKLDALGIRYRLVNFVHDEFVTEVYGDRDTADLVGRIQSAAIAEVGRSFGIRCPLSGEYKVGLNWLEVH